MPLKKYTTYNENHDVYDWPAQYVTPNLGIYEALVSWRKEHIKDQEEMITAQKLGGDTAKFFKEEGRHFLKLQRACTYMIPWFGPQDKGQKEIPSMRWPIELCSELDEISYRIILDAG